MKNYVILAALVLGFFGGIAPAFGEIAIGDNVTFLNFSEGKAGGLGFGQVLNISDDGDWLLIHVPPNDLMTVSKLFVFSEDRFVTCGGGGFEMCGGPCPPGSWMKGPTGSPGCGVGMAMVCCCRVPC
jgi:hypothetical protein